MFRNLSKNRKRIYMDYASSTPLDRRVERVMRRCSARNFANPSAIHKEGVSAREAIDEARATIAQILGAHPDEIIFTSGGTESDNLAILGSLRAQNREDRRTKEQKNPSPLAPLPKGGGLGGGRISHVVTTNIEHSAVRETCRALASQGKIQLSEVPVEQNGIVDPDRINRALREDTVLVSVMYANNEIGTIQPIPELAKIIRKFRKQKNIRTKEPRRKASFQRGRHKNSSSVNNKLPLLHTDAAQAANYLPIKVEKLGVDLFTFSGSKVYGPRGIGVLYRKRDIPFSPVMYGGSQEYGLRPGTENTASIVGLAEALRITEEIKEKESKRLASLRDWFLGELKKRFPKIIVNGDITLRLPNNVNISIPGLESELLVLELDARGVAISARSACKSAEVGESYVTAALRPNHAKEDVSAEAIAKEESSLRFSLGRKTTKSDIKYVLRALEDILKKYGKSMN